MQIKGIMMKAVMYSRKRGIFEIDDFWSAKREVKVLAMTKRSIKVKYHWWLRSKWYPLNGTYVQFDLIPSEKNDK